MAFVLTIGDCHEDIEWIKKILKQENNARDVDKIVFLGDFFDSKSDNTAGSKETARFMMSLDQEFGGKIVWHIGNHDISYYYCLEAARNYSNIKFNPFYCSGFTDSKARKIAKILSDEFVQKQKLATCIDNVLYSHAGATPDLFNLIYENGNQKVDLAGFLKEADEVALNFKINVDHPFLRVGVTRGGYHATGGLTWCDGSREFWTNGLMPFQVNGHTPRDTPWVMTGAGGFCQLDCRQTWYAIVENGLEITLKNPYTLKEETRKIHDNFKL